MLLLQNSIWYGKRYKNKMSYEPRLYQFYLTLKLLVSPLNFDAKQYTTYLKNWKRICAMLTGHPPVADHIGDQAIVLHYKMMCIGSAGSFSLPLLDEN